MVSMSENGKLKLDALDLQIFLGGLFEKCNNGNQVNWLEEQIQGTVELIADERREEID